MNRMWPNGKSSRAQRRRKKSSQESALRGKAGGVEKLAVLLSPKTYQRHQPEQFQNALKYIAHGVAAILILIADVFRLVRFTR